MNSTRYRQLCLFALTFGGALAVFISASGCASTTRRSQPGATAIHDASGSLAQQLAANVATDRKLRVGVLPFSEKTSQTTALNSVLQESLKNRLFLSKRFDVVEDTDMQKALQELQVQEQGKDVLQSDTIHRVGELLATDAIVVGTITEFDDAYLVVCRLCTG